REVTLTEASRLYSRSLSDAFSQVHAATRDFVSADEMRSLTIYAPITFTLHWLTKRLASFHALHPQLGIRITSEGFAPTSFAASEFDVVLRLAGASSGLEAIHLFDLELVPVCSPLYLEQSGVKHPSDLLAHPLLLSERRSADWQNWLKTARVPAQGPLNTLSFHSSALAYQAAADGCGFAIAMKQLVTDELANGTLVTPFDLAAIDGTAFHAVFPTGMDNDPVVRSFLDWIIRETGSSDR
ncbi:MAG TPA: LysR substrate-binding domain-containing protein, partial [Devosia sp.]|nr:LysR substrate-binding domain-containing protein [Devosia sp.]